MRPATPLARRLATVPDPLETYARVSGLPFPILLDSAARGPIGRYSFVTADPIAVFRSRGVRTERRARGTTGWLDVPGDVLTAVAREIGGFTAAALPGVPPFQGGAAGYVGYEWGGTLERVPLPGYDDLQLPDVVLGCYDWVIAWDHELATAWIVSAGFGQGDAAARLAEVHALLSHSAPTPRASPPGGSAPRPASHAVPAFAPLPVQSTFTPDGYRAAVERVRQYILAGDVFQVNVSQRFELRVTMPALELYRRIRARHPAPFAALMETEECAILSASPERFLRLDGRRVEARPIKGTRPRGHRPAADDALAAELLASGKDRAENVMIVDLLRNDLSRVCRAGSVTVPELCVLERHPTVHHLVSTVTGELREGVNGTDLLRAAFPGGSITGAPKVRAMQIIAELEPVRRGVYCGAIGYLSATGAMDTSIAIRTVVLQGDRACLSAGGGVTAQSDPAAEYLETLDKARGLIAAMGGA